MAVTSTHFTVSRAIAAWRPLPVWPAQTSVCSAGGTCNHFVMRSLPFVYCIVWLPRHHTNPVGTEWRWKMDDPQTILNGALDSHYMMVKQFKGE